MAGYRPQNRGNRSGNRTGSTVSRRLRDADWNISSSARKYEYAGVFVSGRGDYVSVLIDLDNDDANRVAAAGILAEVWGWPQVSGAEATRSENGSWSVRFTYRPIYT